MHLLWMHICLIPRATHMGAREDAMHVPLGRITLLLSG